MNESQTSLVSQLSAWSELAGTLDAAQTDLLAERSETFLQRIAQADRIAQQLAGDPQTHSSRFTDSSLREAVLRVQRHTLILTAILRRRRRTLSLLGNLCSSSDPTYGLRGR